MTVKVRRLCHRRSRRHYPRARTCAAAPECTDLRSHCALVPRRRAKVDRVAPSRSPPRYCSASRRCSMAIANRVAPLRLGGDLLLLPPVRTTNRARCHRILLCPNIFNPPPSEVSKYPGYFFRGAEIGGNYILLRPNVPKTELTFQISNAASEFISGPTVLPRPCTGLGEARIIGNLTMENSPGSFLEFPTPGIYREYFKFFEFCFVCFNI